MDVQMWENESGRCPVSEFIEQLPAKTQNKIIWCIDLLEEHGLELLNTKFMSKLHGYELYELRVFFNKVWYRILFPLIGQTFWFVHIFTKKSNETPKYEIDTATNRVALIKKQLEHNNVIINTKIN